jgi:hypothetical protein
MSLPRVYILRCPREYPTVDVEASPQVGVFVNNIPEVKSWFNPILELRHPIRPEFHWKDRQKMEKQTWRTHFLYRCAHTKRAGATKVIETRVENTIQPAIGECTHMSEIEITDSTPVITARATTGIVFRALELTTTLKSHCTHKELFSQ